MNKRLFTGLAVAGTLAIATPLLVGAQGSLAAGDGPRAEAPQREAGAPRQERMSGDHAMYGEHGGYGHGHHMRGHHGGDEMGGYGFGPRMMRGLNLSEAQRDKLFELRHGAAPKFREQGKIVREARRDLHALSMSDGYDEAKAKAIAERASTAMAEMAQLRARNANEFWKLLAPEQRQKLADRAARGDDRRGGSERGGSERGTRS